VIFLGGGAPTSAVFLAKLSGAKGAVHKTFPGSTKLAKDDPDWPLSLGRNGICPRGGGGQKNRSKNNGPKARLPPGLKKQIYRNPKKNTRKKPFSLLEKKKLGQKTIAVNFPGGRREDGRRLRGGGNTAKEGPRAVKNKARAGIGGRSGKKKKKPKDIAHGFEKTKIGRGAIYWGKTPQKKTVANPAL